MKDFNQIIDQYKDDMINDLSELIAIRSVAEETGGEHPFGEGVHQAFEAMLAMGKRDGFEVKNVDNYGGHIEFKGEGDGIFALLGHLDIVPEGSGWDTDPYKATIIGDKLFGRGSIDDKGPTIVGYYAMKALKEAGFKPKKDIRLIIGLDEETNWDGIKYYMEKETTPDMGFAPDADFPVIHCEKGLIIFDVIKKLTSNEETGTHLVSLSGGTAANMVADTAEVVIKGKDAKEIIEKYVSQHDYDITVTEEADTIKVTVKGVSAHGAMPEEGLNAITILCEALQDINFDNEDVNAFFKFYNETIGFDFNGQRFGIGFEDEPSGKLNFNVGILKIDGDEIRLTINVRYPATLKEEDIYNGIETINRGYEIEKVDHLEPLYVPKDYELVKVLMEVYQEFTGDMQSQPLVIGGATYARTVPNCVAFGPVFPGQDSVEHQPNEYFSIESMIKSAKMYAEAIYRLCK